LLKSWVRAQINPKRQRGAFFLSSSPALRIGVAPFNNPAYHASELIQYAAPKA
jgi:hypothetical protein